ncbi:hypothetical protein E8E13_007519 [Curvularia kusanoi]|uniref:Uncharacterized protein n=1 Tax=Curvularia kusanoi TaxID=90978 RepID=A0A9P4WAV5_CURKU|nr:hypothetical protein E8E13_007519 [Curvularia kusanoi]
MTTNFTLEYVAAPDTSNSMLEETVNLFSSAYGIWGPLASEKMGKFCKPGNRIKMSVQRLREQSLASGTDSVLVRGLAGSTLAGYAFATRWDFQGRQICWVTQLCILRRLASDGKENAVFGILSSHPAAILGAARAWGCGIERLDLPVIRERAAGVIASSPVAYVRNAKFRGSLLGDEDQEGSCCADTQFWVDHRERLAALAELKEKGVAWPYGPLPEGCEFLLLVEAGDD